MTKTHYINQRYYQNERTILFNPSKPFRKNRKRSSKPSFLRYLIIVLIIFSGFIGYSAFAGGPKPNEGWITKTDTDGVAIKHHGNITHGDSIYIFLSKNDCNSATWISSIYTMAENNFEPLVSRYLPYKIQSSTNKSDYGYTTAQLISVKPFLLGHRAMIYFGDYPIQNYLQWFRSGDEYYLEIIKASKELIEQEYGGVNEDIISINPTEFFDIQMNAYYFEGFNKALIDAQKQCRDLGVTLLS
ncbi:hypothetical protein N8903_02195 [Pelagibacterales bacterium]|nr:hypothetical protein [Pelagibacterales bacterium]